MMPLVSVVIPTYNCGEYIQLAIDSVLGQSFKDYEIIVIDDGSQDDTKKILSKYSEKIRYFFQSNCGPGRARNEAIKKSKGRYIAFLDADDQWKPFKLEMQILILEKLKDVSFLFANYDQMDECGYVFCKSVIERGFPVFKEYQTGLKSFFHNSINLQGLRNCPAKDNTIYYGNVFCSLFKGNFILPSTVILRKSCLETNTWFEEKYRCAEDQDFHLRLSRTNIFAYVDCSLVNYRANRKNKLSGNNNIPDLILNTIKSREEVLRKYPSFAQKNTSLVKEVMARHFSRLSYYYLSVFDCKKAALFARKSLSYDYWHIKAWVILFLSRFPGSFLGLVYKIKSVIA